MDSKIAKAIRSAHEPVAILWSEEKPDDAKMFKEKTSYQEVEHEHPKAIAGPMDLSAMLYLHNQFGESGMRMSIP